MTTEELKALITAWFFSEGENPGTVCVVDYDDALFGDKLSIDGDFDIGALAAHILQHQQNRAI